MVDPHPSAPVDRAYSPGFFAQRRNFKRSFDEFLASRPRALGSGKVNPSTRPTFASLYGFVAKTGRQIRRWHMEPLVDAIIRTRLQRVLATGDPLPGARRPD